MAFCSGPQYGGKQAHDCTGPVLVMWVPSHVAASVLMTGTHPIRIGFQLAGLDALELKAYLCARVENKKWHTKYETGADGKRISQ